MTADQLGDRVAVDGLFGTVVARQQDFGLAASGSRAVADEVQDVIAIVLECPLEVGIGAVGEEPDVDLPFCIEVVGPGDLRGIRTRDCFRDLPLLAFDVEVVSRVGDHDEHLEAPLDLLWLQLLLCVQFAHDGGVGVTCEIPAISPQQLPRDLQQFGLAREVERESKPALFPGLVDECLDVRCEQRRGEPLAQRAAITRWFVIDDAGDPGRGC